MTSKKLRRKIVVPLIKLLFSRVFLVALLIALQITLIAIWAIAFTEHYVIIASLSAVISFLATCHIISDASNPGYKIAWILVVCLLPPAGVAMYYIFSGSTLSRKVKATMSRITSITETLKEDQSQLMRVLASENPDAARQSTYMDRMSMCPPYTNTDVVYYPSGEAFLPSLLEALEGAERYIFLEYFIVSHGEMWESIRTVLTRKAAEGVDVRLIYDDFGSITRLSRKYAKELQAMGIRCCVFHPFVPVLDARQNNRDHRKICVVDGKVAFTGGINIGDEYINVTSPHGYWKDNAVRLTGEGAWSFTLMFLTMWDYLAHPTAHGDERSYEKYRPVSDKREAGDKTDVQISSEGIVQPYTDNPLDSEAVGENIYLHILYQSRRYVWLTTPYLIIDEQMKQALCTAARSGVDVRIITPGIPDKRTIYETTRSYYRRLLENGVRVYEYTPGFLHAKTFLADDLYGTVGSVNLDFRSLFLHFECGVWLYRAPVLADIKKDFTDILAVSREITLADCKVGFLRRLYRSVLEILSPLM